MAGIALDKRIEEALTLIEGRTPEEKIVFSVIKVLEHRLEDCHRKLGSYEAKYGMPFRSFIRAWEKGEIPGKHSSEVESDYMDWEAYEMERRNLLRVLRKLRPVVSKN
ncbi:MAG: hypothetical protein D9V47_02005 [Clostridia bacterium]|nr:MAG: hypothetical protein D9V47_02005 [Clostridia bacterium]